MVEERLSELGGRRAFTHTVYAGKAFGDHFNYGEGESAQQAEAAIEWIPFTGGGSYSVSLDDLSIGGRSLGFTHRSFGTTIVDSGTSFMYLPPTIYNAVVSECSRLSSCSHLISS